MISRRAALNRVYGINGDGKTSAVPSWRLLAIGNICSTVRYPGDFKQANHVVVSRANELGADVRALSAR